MLFPPLAVVKSSSLNTGGRGFVESLFQFLCVHTQRWNDVDSNGKMAGCRDFLLLNV